LCAGHGEQQTARHADQRQPRAFDQHHAAQIARRRSERGADGELAPALVDESGEYAVKTDGGENGG